MARLTWCSVIVSIVLLLGILPSAGSVASAQDMRYFPETGRTVRGVFLQYWDQHGGLAQQGYPISEVIQEKSAADGKNYTVQYFERAVFELHPENPAPHNVLLSLIGKFYYKERYNGNAPDQKPSTDNPRKFAETGKTIGGKFRAYWESHGGLAQQGYPISDEFSEVSQVDGKTYTVQYFERAVFEYHPEFAGTANEVQLSLLGSLYFTARYGGMAQPTAAPQATATPAPVGAVTRLLFLKTNGTGQLALVDSEGGVFPYKPLNLPAKTYAAVEALGGGYIFAYDWNGTALLKRVDEEGVLRNIAAMFLSPGWAHVTSFQNALVFYTPRGTAPGVGIIDVVRLHVPLDGRFTDQGNLPFGNLPRLLAATSNGVLVTYWDDDAHGSVATWRVEAGRGMTFLKQRGDLPRGVTSITRLYNDDMLLYNRNDGSTYIGRVAADGTFNRAADFKMAQGWTSLSQAFNDIIVTYNRNNGVLYTVRPEYQSNRYTILRHYGPDGTPGSPVTSGWDFVVSLR